MMTLLVDSSLGSRVSHLVLLVDLLLRWVVVNLLLRVGLHVGDLGEDLLVDAIAVLLCGLHHHVRFKRLL